MDSFATIKRRTTDLASSIPIPPALQNIQLPTSIPAIPTLPAMPALPNLTSVTSNITSTMAPLSSSSQPHTLKATWEQIILPSKILARSSHTINVVAGTAYLFGGETCAANSGQARQPVDNDMHVITLPASGAGADYYSIKAKAAPRATPPPPDLVVESHHDGDQERRGSGLEVPARTAGVAQGSRSFPTFGGDVPPPRVGHASGVIGSRIFIFGGRSGADSKTCLDEGGRVWVFDTQTKLWNFLDPLHPVSNDVASPVDGPQYPRTRSFHAAVGVDQPRDFAAPGTAAGKTKKKETWMQWAKGDADKVGIPQEPKVGYVARHARDEDGDGYGTFIVHAGCFDDGTRGNDTWAFDVRTRVWQELPSAPGNPRGGTSIAVSKSRLYRFGGFNGHTEEGGQLDYLELGIDSFSSPAGASRDVVLSAKSGKWQSIIRQSAEAQLTAAAQVQDEERVGMTAALKSVIQDWPGNRSVAGLETVTTGGGREYIVLMLGEGDPSTDGHAAAGKFFDDIWAFEVPAHHLSEGQSVKGTQAGTMDKVLGMLGKVNLGGHGDNNKGKWFRVEMGSFDVEDEAAALGPGPRGWFASAPLGDVDERGVLIWGGLNATNQRLGDGWILRLGKDKREV